MGCDMKRQSKKVAAIFGVLLKLVGVFLLCYLQTIWALYRMPEFLLVALWVVYVAQILILSCRLFGIKVSQLMHVVPDLLSTKQK